MNINVFKKIFSSYKNYGFIKTNSIVIMHLKSRYQLYKEKKFDMKYDIETRHHISSMDLKIESKNKKYAFRYEPISNVDFYASVKYLDIRHEEYVFIDVGAGKGRALLLASNFPFKELIGIEFSKEIYNIAKKNINKFKSITKKNSNINFLYMDAETYTFPNENIVLFLYNPFDGQVLYNFIDKIKEHVENTTKDFIIVYHYPMYSELYNKQSFLKLKVCTKEYCIYGRL